MINQEKKDQNTCHCAGESRDISKKR